MPSFTLFRNQLTNFTNNYIDWSRFGTLFFSNHKYSNDELAARGLIIFMTAVSGLLGSQLKDGYFPESSRLKLGVIFGALGFLVTHAAVTYPLFKKRYKMGAECNRLINEIKTHAASIPEISPKKLDDLVNYISQLSLADEKGAHASLTWGNRVRLLSELYDEIKQGNDKLIAMLKDDSSPNIDVAQFKAFIDEKSSNAEQAVSLNSNKK